MIIAPNYPNCLFNPSGMSSLFYQSMRFFLAAR